MATILSVADVCAECGSSGVLSFTQAASCGGRGGSNSSIVSQLWERDRQNTPVSLCHTTGEVWEKYALR